MAWLLRDGDVLAAAEIAHNRAGRRRGLIGRDSFEGALVIKPCRQVHTFGMRFAIDVVFCDDAGVVLRTVTMVPRRCSAFVWRARWVVEARAGSVDRWRLRPGDVIEMKL